jgi:hypothetical protein
MIPIIVASWYLTCVYSLPTLHVIRVGLCGQQNMEEVVGISFPYQVMKECNERVQLSWAFSLLDHLL